MKILKIAVVSFLLISCGKSDDINIDSPVIGKWQLKELYIDPGDGSGEFGEVESDKTIEFFSNGKVTSNGSLCRVSADANVPTSGTFSISTFTIYSPGCFNGEIPFMDIFFRLEGDYLKINKPCFEGCAEIYSRL
ncbi:MAG TPA: lipocalin family protein [Gillisia sp.]|nr:lipocalin family protein [Gillisia sp.]